MGKVETVGDKEKSTECRIGKGFLGGDGNVYGNGSWISHEKDYEMTMKWTETLVRVFC